MTSILTNVAATSALQTLRTINSSLTSTQQEVSSGLRVKDAADNAAYWSIATTMRSDRGAISALQDALGLGAAKIDTAYAGMESVVDVLAEFQAKLVTAKEPGIDKGKVQEELDQLKEQVISIAGSSSFSGENWLNTKVHELDDPLTNTASVVDSFSRSPKYGVSVSHTEVHLSEVSLFNSTGGGILDPDLRDLKSIGGLRTWGYRNGEGDYIENWNPDNIRGGGPGGFSFDFSGPLVFRDPLLYPTDQITFDVTVDMDDPSTGLPSPLNPGHTTSITIDRALVDAALPGKGGIISTNQQYAQVLNYALQQAGSGATVFANYLDPETKLHDPEAMTIYTNEDRTLGLDGSYMGISNFSSAVGSGGLGDNERFGSKGSTITLNFAPFEVYKDGDDPGGVEVSLTFGIDQEAPIRYSFDRFFVTSALGKINGKIETADEMVTVLQKLLSEDWPTLIVESNSSDSVTLRTDPAMERLQEGSRTYIGFTDMSVSIEPVSTLDFRSLDIENDPNSVDASIQYIEKVSKKVISAATMLGSLQSRIGMQSDFADRLTDTIDRGIGRLVDADLDKASVRLKALQTQQQLGLQSLQIANSGAENIMQLFR